MVAFLGAQVGVPNVNDMVLEAIEYFLGQTGRGDADTGNNDGYNKDDKQAVDEDNAMRVTIDVARAFVKGMLHNTQYTSYAISICWEAQLSCKESNSTVGIIQYRCHSPSSSI